LLGEAEIKAELRERLVADVRSFADGLAKYLPEPGDTAAISFLTPRGYEAYSYNTGTMPDMDTSRPLAALNHVGGDPMCVIAAHGGDLTKAFDELINLL